MRYLKLILLSTLFISFFSPAKSMEEGRSSASGLNPSLIFSGDMSPNKKMGQALKDAGFTQTSVKEIKKGYIHYGMYEGLDDDIYSSSFVKTFSKRGVTVTYKYAIDKFDGEVDFDYIDITFPSRTERETFLLKLKRELKKHGLNVYRGEDSNIFYVGDDDEDLKNGLVYSYNQFEIKGNKVSFTIAHDMNPHSTFED